MSRLEEASGRAGAADASYLKIVLIQPLGLAAAVLPASDDARWGRRSVSQETDLNKWQVWETAAVAVNVRHWVDVAVLGSAPVAYSAGIEMHKAVIRIKADAAASQR